MKRMSLLAASFFILMIWIVPVNVGAQASPASPNPSDRGVDQRVVPPYMSVRDKVMVQREIQERAAASRNALKRQAWLEEQAQQKKSGTANR